MILFVSPHVKAVFNFGLWYTLIIESFCANHFVFALFSTFTVP